AGLPAVGVTAPGPRPPSGENVSLSCPPGAVAFTCGSSPKPLRRRAFGAVDMVGVPGYLSLRSQAAAGIESPEGPPGSRGQTRRAQAPRSRPQAFRSPPAPASGLLGTSL